MRSRGVEWFKMAGFVGRRVGSVRMVVAFVVDGVAERVGNASEEMIWREVIAGLSRAR